jgi:hypothetical protein
MGLFDGNKIRRNRGRPLMDELHKGMLAVGPGFAENDWASFAGNGIAVAVHRFTVRFHIHLLNEFGKPRKAVVIGQEQMGRIVEEIPVPDA